MIPIEVDEDFEGWCAFNLKWDICPDFGTYIFQKRFLYGRGDSNHSKIILSGSKSSIMTFTVGTISYNPKMPLTRSKVNKLS